MTAAARIEGASPLVLPTYADVETAAGRIRASPITRRP